MPGKTSITNVSSTEEIFQAFENLNVLVIGDVMIDSYLWGRVDRISPEAPVPIVNVQKRDQRLGGAANVALNIQALGAKPILCSAIGDDIDGDTFLALVQRNNMTTEGIVRCPGRVTTIKHRILSGSHHMLRVDSETDECVNDQTHEKLIAKAFNLLPSCDVVIFEDYDKGVITPTLINTIVDHAASLKIPVVVDPKKRNFLSYRNVTLFKPNRKELREGLKLDGDLLEKEELQKAVKDLRELINASTVLITLSDQGVYIEKKDEKHLVPAHKREISDVSGAGDTVISVAALCCALKLPPLALASLSNLAGGLVCEQVGVAPVNKEIFLKEALRLSF